MLALTRAIFVPVLILGFCAIYLYRNRSVPASDMMLVWPAAVILAILILVEIARQVRAHRPPAVPFREVARPLAFLFATAVFAWAAAWDFIIAGALLTAVILVVLGEKRPAVVLGNATVLPILLFYTFDRIMGVPLDSFLWAAVLG